MAAPAPQSFAHHRRLIFGFHGVTASILVANLVWRVVQAVRGFAVGTLLGVLLAVALVLLFLYARAFATGNQDRIIRLEETLRLQRLLPADLQGRVGELTVAQLVGLRFASDAELPTLARKVLEEGIRGREEIKKLIQVWRPDHHRV